jgi:hypothetical protein
MGAGHGQTGEPELIEQQRQRAIHKAHRPPPPTAVKPALIRIVWQSRRITSGFPHASEPFVNLFDAPESSTSADACTKWWLGTLVSYNFPHHVVVLRDTPVPRE